MRRVKKNVTYRIVREPLPPAELDRAIASLKACDGADTRWPRKRARRTGVAQTRGPLTIIDTTTGETITVTKRTATSEARLTVAHGETRSFTRPS